MPSHHMPQRAPGIVDPCEAQRSRAIRQLLQAAQRVEEGVLHREGSRARGQGSGMHGCSWRNSVA